MMAVIFRISTLIVLLGPLVALQGCWKNSTPQPLPAAVQTEYLKYSNDGLSLKYPKHWSLSFDDAPSLNADRGLGFRVSEASMAYVYILNDQNVQLESLVEKYIDELDLEHAEHIKNYVRKTIRVGVSKGEVLTFTETFLAGSTDVVITLVALPHSSKTVFTVFNFSDEDISNNSQFIEPFTSSVSLN